MVRPRRRRRFARWAALGLVVLLGLLYYRPVRAYVETKRTLRARTADVAALAEGKHELEDRLAEIRSGSTLVRGARRLGLVKPGERLFIVRGIDAWRLKHK